MGAYWIKLRDPETGKTDAFCVEAASKVEAIGIVTIHRRGNVTSCMPLPYPASPRVGPQSEIPAFCYDPGRCAGHQCCPKDYACSE